MANTVVGIFEYESDAQEAQNYLLANGFGDGDVDIKTASYKSDAETATATGEADLDVMDRIGNFFKDLFDGDEEQTKKYSEAGKRGSIVTVHTATSEEAEEAADILDQFGAVDVNAGAVDYDPSLGYSGSVAEKPMGVYTDETADTYSSESMDSYDDKTLNSYDDKTLNNYSEKSVDSYDDTSLNSYTEKSFTEKSFDSVEDRLPLTDDQSESLPVIEEELQVGKREIETGGVRLRSRIFERPVQEIIRLRQEQVNVSRTPVDRIASESDFDTFKEGTIEMKEYAEIPVVSKEARVVEEVSLNKTTDVRDEVINETLRNTEVDVEDLTDEERLRRSGLDL